MKIVTNRPIIVKHYYYFVRCSVSQTILSTEDSQRFDTFTLFSSPGTYRILFYIILFIMGLCNIECVERIARYLDVSSGKLEVSDKNVIFIQEKNLPSIQGFSTIVQTLVRNSKCADDIFGNKKEAQALILQWLEYIVICINYADVPINAKRILNELNTVLKDAPYITGTKKTLADIVLYYVLHFIMKELSYQQKAQYIHVSRWFDNIQQEEKLRQELDLISFNLLHLFL